MEISVLNIIEKQRNFINSKDSYGDIIEYIDSPDFYREQMSILNGSLVSYNRYCSIYGGICKFMRVEVNYKETVGLTDRLGIMNSVGFKNIYNRYIIPYCKTNGIKDYIIPESVFIGICNLGDGYNIDNIVLYFEYYCSYGFNVSLDFLKEVSNMFKINQVGIDINIISNVIEQFPFKVQEYKNGKENLINFFFGEYLKRLKDKSIDKDVLKLSVKEYLNNL